MKDVIKQIEEFIPSCEQEEVDKELFLYVAENIPNSLTRDSLIGHFTVSAWVMNEAKDKVLCAFHNIYQSWAWLGGHCDGDGNLLRVIEKEIEEESGIKNFRPYKDGIFSLESAPVFAHMKNGKYIPAHVHLNLTYVFIADDKCVTRIAEGENTDVGWKGFEELVEITKEEHFKPIYKKIIDKIRKLEEKQK